MVYIINEKEKQRELSFVKSDQGLFVFEYEVINIDGRDEKVEFTYNKCDDFVHGNLDKRLIRTIEYFLECKSQKFQLSRWYPNVHPCTFLSSGKVYIVTVIERKLTGITLTFKFNKKRTISGKEEEYIYTISGVEEIKRFLKFLKED